MSFRKNLYGQHINYSVLEEKWGLFFQFLDFNKDQCINEYDMMEMTSNVFTVFPGESGHDVVEALKSWWTVFKSHVGSTRHLSTEAEFVSAMRSLFDADKKSFRGSVSKMSSAMFHLLDRNNDGIITRSEYVKMFWAMGVENCCYVGRVFDKLDIDNSGVLEEDEFLSAIRDFFLCDNPDNSMAFIFNFPPP